MLENFNERSSDRKKNILSSLSLLIAGFGMVLFIGAAFAFPFRDSLFVDLFDKLPSDAADITVQPKGQAMSGSGDIDDPAIWIHPTDPAKSLFFLSDKAGEIHIYDAGQNFVQLVSFSSTLNNIDTRYGFNLGGQQIDIVSANLRSAGRLAVLRIKPDWTQGDAVEVLAGDDCPATTCIANTIQTESYGFTLYKRASDGNVYVFDKPKDGSPIKQYHIDGSSGQINVQEVRTISDVSIGVAEGFVADDQLGYVYFSEEDGSGGVHQYNADPDSSNQNRVGNFGNSEFTGQREGTTLYACNDGTGYIIVSNQSGATGGFFLYDRQNPTSPPVKTFVASGASNTDGLDVSNAAIPGFPNGFLIIQDDGGKNYHMYDWADVAGTDLVVCPNGGGGGSSPTSTPAPSPTPGGGGTPGLGDFNGDNTVDVRDLGIFAACYGKTVAISPSCLSSDLDASGNVDVKDLGVFASVYGTVYGGGIAPSLPTSGGGGNTGNSTDPNLKVAFIADSGGSSEFASVLSLIQSEGAQLVLHQGDFGYSDGPDAWASQVANVLPAGFPYLGSIGNHDTDGSYGTYQTLLQGYIDAAAGMDCTATDDVGVNTYCTYKGLSVVLSGVGEIGSGHLEFVNTSFANDPALWKICSWHKNQTALQTGGKSDDIGWDIVTACKDHGAIIAMGHEHSYSRTKTLDVTSGDGSESELHVDPTCADDPSTPGTDVCVGEGRTFTFVSGIAGRSARSNERCPNIDSFPCNIFSSLWNADISGGDDWGALFITFNVNGDPKLAEGYFKTTGGQTIDQFRISRD